MKKSIKNLVKVTISMLLIISISSCKKGDTGPAGKDGNANVIATNTFTVNSSNWEYHSSSGGYYTLGITSPNITKDIVEKGMVMCYAKLTPDAWIALPYDDYMFFIVPGGAGIIYNYNANPGTQTYRLVVVSSAQMKTNPTLDLTNYNDVKEKLNIPD